MPLKLSILMFALFLASGCTSQATAPYPATLPAADASAQMRDTRISATADQKLAVYVLGGNWCHDSTDFAKLIEDPSVQPWLNDRFSIEMINVGYLEHIREYVEPYSVPIIYATPTVMVVEPDTNTLLNRDSLSYWRSASTMTTADVRKYFEQFSSVIPPANSYSPALNDALARIDEFENQQAERIYQAYAVLGPMIATLDAGEAAPDFEKHWVNLAKMRAAMGRDLAKLRESAKRQDAQGVEKISLDFPTYARFIDAA